jgi:large subunit ribosomal protein L21
MSTSTSSKYAVVDHSEAYEESIRGPHGKQLELAKLEGLGKDDPPFNPFLEDELEEERERLAAEEEARTSEDGEDNEEIDDGDEEEEEDFDDDEEENDDISPFNNDGSLRWKKSELAIFRAGAPAGGLFAVVELAGSQHKVTTDDLLVVNLLKPVSHYKVGSVHTLKDVMLVGSSHMTCVGMPYVSGSEVDVMVEEITQDAKVIVFKKRRRKTYKRKNGFRRDITMLRILEIRPPKEVRDHKFVQREIPEP